MTDAANHTNRAPSASSVGASIFIICWLLFWTAIVMVFNVIFFSSIVDAARSQSFPFVLGSITRSQIVRSGGGDGSHVEVEYEYFVGRDRYENDAVRFGMNMTGLGRLQKVVDRYPEGSEVPVYYDPDDPSHAALEQGLVPSDLFMPIFLTPFNMVMIGGWYLLMGPAIRRFLGWPPSGMRARSSGMSQIFYAYKIDPLLLMLIAAGAAGFACTFVVGFGLFFLPAWLLIPLGYLAMLAITLYVWAQNRPSRIELNLVKGTLTTSDEMEVIDTSRIKAIAARESTASKGTGMLVIDVDEHSVDVPCNSLVAAEWLKQQLEEALRLKN